MNSKRNKKQQMQMREWMAAAKPILDKLMQRLVEEREQEERQITDFFTRTF